MSGLVHLYCGDGKGKTSAAVGLAVRAAGAGKRVLFVQFFKDGSSSEIPVLKSIKTVTVRVCNTVRGFYKNMEETEREQCGRDAAALLEECLEHSKTEADVLILDEAVSACNHAVISEETLLRFLQAKPSELEVVLTGRDPSPALLAAADYVTEMKKVRHPYDRGVPARRGIEF